MQVSTAALMAHPTYSSATYAVPAQRPYRVVSATAVLGVSVIPTWGFTRVHHPAVPYGPHYDDAGYGWVFTWPS